MPVDLIPNNALPARFGGKDTKTGHDCPE